MDFDARLRAALASRYEARWEPRPPSCRPYELPGEVYVHIIPGEPHPDSQVEFLEARQVDPVAVPPQCTCVT